ncbi:2-succinyl-6-hydroxy-2,4-cyclohexadiene-1-carboxylic acid synthase/2-oxoglutarate decarboxylase [Kordia algicida OT-1]|uniref:2-succinyl-5-enolpyruvyl-6-hydroxy-3-cyclohexene-1-carboxylate synthase n=2 Tax=Kordia TaxID=221065 RepID=A9DV13_9FLAO|nr:2-succinyl-5-enolpyruvyl-6-hydroxy-3-cyclohexene-1-carboxylic-acid synthase [Kordia algicida]EDP96360.1 2-succinyl-6-hydroxy-2,4-cyclohexadiene-1-carboxylic acid synthase/2-oxoglutarate decarboxylase [Kordia algicida OT-1]
MYSKIPLAQTLVSLCIAKGINHVVISPGSRNAPLTLSFSQHPKIQAYSIVDERCAAFFALGMAQQLCKPVAVICTSGSAVLNYYPAIAEAYYSNIPVVVISADRPEYLIDVGDGQTIRQKHIFKNHINYEANLKQDITHKRTILSETHQLSAEMEQELQQRVQSYNEAEINQALNAAVEKNGPVHINAPFDEPLYEMLPEPTVFPKVQSLVLEEEIDHEKITKAAAIWSNSARKMVLVGTLPPHTISKKYLEILANDPSVLVFTETTSNLRDDKFFNKIDQMILPIEKNEAMLDEFQPEILLTLGGMIVSKKVKAILRKRQPAHHWHIHENRVYDTFFCLEHFFKINPNHFFELFFAQTKPIESSYKSFWNAIKKERQQKHEVYLQQAQFTDLKAFEAILASLPPSLILHLGNSSTVRYAQLFEIDSSIELFCNRGTSGIDGSTSTAIGTSVVAEKQTLLITGDLSFLYDSNALWNNYIPKNFRIILVNNNGGGIFRILPGNKNTENFDTYFETIHPHTGKQLAEMYHFEYLTATDEMSLQKALQTFYDVSKQPKILEVFTPRIENDGALIDYFKFFNEKK